MLEKIIGKRKSLQRNLVIAFIICSSVFIVVTIIEFLIFALPRLDSKLLEVVSLTESERKNFYSILQQLLVLVIINIGVISYIITYVSTNLMVKPIKKLNDATKQVSQGNFDIELTTKRKDEIGELTVNFNHMIKELASTEKIQNDFMNNVSHELKTPISSIERFANLLKDENISHDEIVEYSDIIIEESKRVTNLTGNMLKLSKLHNQERLIKEENLDILSLVKKAVSSLEPKWIEKNISFNIAGNCSKVLGDEELILQALINIIENAIKYSKANSSIDIILSNENNKNRVEIKNYGSHIQEENLDKIFDRFYQIDSSHSNQGFGLGLAIVKRIIELHNANVFAVSKDDFTSFIIEFDMQKSELENIEIR